MRLTLRQKFGGHISGCSYIEYSGHLVPNMELVSARCHIADASWYECVYNVHIIPPSPAKWVSVIDATNTLCIYSPAGQSNRSRQERQSSAVPRHPVRLQCQRGPGDWTHHLHAAGPRSGHDRFGDVPPDGRPRWQVPAGARNRKACSQGHTRQGDEEQVRAPDSRFRRHPVHGGICHHPGNGSTIQ